MHSNGFVAIHGHFYQPPRENPWLEVLEREESARPFHDWNERIAFECYRPNAYARIVDDVGKIVEILNNYSFMNFDFGPTLLPWIEERFPRVYGRILEADRESLRRFGHGSAMAQAYNHVILPLANERDKETEIRWGVADFEKRFRRRPHALWLPETAVNYPTLQVLAKHGMEFLILSPFQALRTRPFGGRRWTDVSGGRIDPTQPYRCFLKDASGKKTPDRFIDIFFYDGLISREVSFEEVLKNGNRFSQRFAQAHQPSKGRPQLIHIATDGETYGHHRKFGDLTLAYALNKGFEAQGLETINYMAFLKRFPPVHEVEIDEGPNGEGTSWSCVHGVARWKEDCGCSTGGRPGWNQRWRKPLREALNLLRDRLGEIFETEGRSVFKDPWEARNGYIDVILERSPENLNRLFYCNGVEGLDGSGRTRGLKLLEMQRHALQMYTSCGWFFADLSGLEATIVLQHAARALELAGEVTGREFEGEFIRFLSEAKSNIAEMGSGDQVYERLVKPRRVTVDQIVHHYAISSLFDGGENKAVFSFGIEKMDYERVEKENGFLALGRVRVTSKIIPEPKEFVFGLIRSKEDGFRTWVCENKEGLDLNHVKETALDSFGKGEEETARVMTGLLGNRTLTLRDVLSEGKEALLRKFLEGELKEHSRIYADLFEKTRQTVKILRGEGFEIPHEIRVAAEITLSARLLEEVEKLRRDLVGAMDRGEIDKILEEAKSQSFNLSMEEPTQVLNRSLNEEMGDLYKILALSPKKEKEGAEKAQGVIRLLDAAERWGFELRKEEAQDLMDEMLDEYVGSLEESCWGEGVKKCFPVDLITLAERLDFNVERFKKMIKPAVSIDKS